MKLILLAAIAAIAFLTARAWYPVNIRRGSFWRDSSDEALFV